MHGSGSPSATFIVAKRQLAGPDMVSGAGPSWEEARRDAVHAAQAEEAPGPCPPDGPDRPDHHKAAETTELVRPDDGTECPVCRTRTIVEYWVDDESWAKAGLPDGTCVDCFNARGPDGVELKGLYLRGSLFSFEAEKDDKDAWEASNPSIADIARVTRGLGGPPAGIVGSAVRASSRPKRQ